MKDMKIAVTILSAVALAGCFGVAKTDVQTKALAPIELDAPAAGGPLELVKDGKAQFAFVVFKSHGKYTGGDWRDAHKVLTNAFFQTCGVMPELLDCEKDKDRLSSFKYKFLIGKSPLTDEMGLKVEDLRFEGFRIMTKGDTIAIFGCDEQVLTPEQKKVPHGGSNKGTYFGAIDFTERFLGVRYLYPGPYGTYWPKLEDVTIDPVSFADWPRFRMRGGPGGNGYYFWQSMCDYQQTNKWFAAMGPVKMYYGNGEFPAIWRDGGVMSRCGHHCPQPQALAKNYTNQLETIFLRGSKSGKLYYNPKQHIGNYYNVVDLKFADLLIDGLKELYDPKYKKDPKLRKVKHDPCCMGGECNDEYITFGVCDTGMSWDEVKDNPIVVKEGLKDWGDVYCRFLQYFAKRCKELWPEKKVYFLAYINAKEPTTNPKWFLPDNVEVHVCDGRLPLRVRNPKEMEYVNGLFDRWYRALGNRPIAKCWLYASGLNPFARAIGPELCGEVCDVLGEKVGRDQFFFDFTGATDLWYYYYAVYAYYKAMWNPAIDVDAAIDDHWEKFYGTEAGRHMKEFHRQLKANYFKYIGCAKRYQDYPQYSVEDLNAMKAEILAAKACLKEGSVEMRRWHLTGDYFLPNIDTQLTRAAYVAPIYTAVKCGAKPDWTKGTAMPMQRPNGSLVPIKWMPEVKLQWNEKGVYGKVVTGEFAPLANPEKSVWLNDSVELLFYPGTDLEVCYHVAYDPVADNADYTCRQRKRPIWQPEDKTWMCDGWKLDNKAEANRWTSEFFIPWTAFDDFGKKAPSGQKWHLNVVVNKLGGDERQTVGNSFTLGDNRNEKMFGFIQFVE